MRSSRITIARAMLAVVAIALGLAVLARPSEMAAKAAFTVAIASVGVAILGTIHTRGPRRAGWNGYLVFAGGYLAICFSPWFVDHIRPQLLPASLIDYGYRDLLSYTPTQTTETVWFPLGDETYVDGRITDDGVG